MKITSKGQVTVPQKVREELGLLPHTEVTFEVVGDWARLRKINPGPGKGARGRAAIAPLRGTANSGMTTDEILALTRGEPNSKHEKKIRR